VLRDERTETHATCALLDFITNSVAFSFLGSSVPHFVHKHQSRGQAYNYHPNLPVTVFFFNRCVGL
jgi:NhaP-type Na+/H+ or K+/H+ antiporter